MGKHGWRNSSQSPHLSAAGVPALNKMQTDVHASPNLQPVLFYKAFHVTTQIGYTFPSLTPEPGSESEEF